MANEQGYEADASSSDWENRLYDLLIAAEDERDNLQAQANELFTLIESARQGHPNLHELQLLGENENTYWRLQERIQAASAHIKALEGTIALLENGTISETELQQRFGEQEAPTETVAQKLSKRRQAIQREQDFLAKQGIEADPYDLTAPPGLEPTHLTTGRHERQVKNPDPENPAADFFWRTTDTHGGKVGHGKKRYKRK